MESVIGTGVARDGRRITIRRVVGPDSQWAETILPFLGHKGGLWRWQLEQLLRSKLDELTFRSYLADAGNLPTDYADYTDDRSKGESAESAGSRPPGSPRIVANICTFEARDVGLFGHVFTRPDWRGQSLARMLTRACIDDFRGRGGQALWLVTGFDSTAYRVYKEFGFEPIQPGDGIMAWQAAGGSAELDRRFAPGQPVTVRSANWTDYATLNALSCSPAGPPQRSSILRVVGRNIVEWSFLSEVMHRRALDQPVRAMVLSAGTSWPVGWVVVGRDFDRRWSPDEATLLDVYTHPNYREHYEELLAAADVKRLAPSRVISVIDSFDQPRQAALAAAGFAAQGRLADVYRWAGRAVDLIVMAR